MNIPNKFIRINNTIPTKYDIPLFCINKGEGNYTYLDFYKAKISMEYLFPIPTPYEIVDYSFLYLSYNTVYSMDEQIKFNKNQMINMISKDNFLFQIYLSVIILLKIIFI